MALKKKTEKEIELDGVTEELIYFAHAHFILNNIKSGELRYYDESLPNRRREQESRRRYFSLLFTQLFFKPVDWL